MRGPKEITIHRSIHDVEEHIIQLQGLLAALQHASSDDGPVSCLITACDERIKSLSEDFYQLWKLVAQKRETK